MSHWEGQVAVITGAASGIGMGLARFCIDQGMKVVAADVDKEGLASLEDYATGKAGDFLAEVVDVRDEAQVERLASLAFDRHGQVNLLFNNAGVLVDGKSWERSVRDWQWIIDVNVMGVIHGLRSFVPRMLEQGAAGRIINTSSVGGLLGGGAFLAPYQGTKHFVAALTESLYQELLQESSEITASVLCPGEVATGIWESDRLRPASEHNVLASEQERQSHDMIAGGVAAGLAPDEFASLVFDEIAAGKFWLLPQPSFKPAYELRSESILQESNPLPTEKLVEMLLGGGS